jgi:xanthine dehydrogenase accessory factor
MNDLGQILTLWRELEKAGTDYVLATVVAVEGSSYRKPGAQMLLAQDGRRVGTVSGGCLEAEVAQRAWWLTSSGPAVERYSTQDDDDERPFGSGCGGVVYLLLERKQTAGPLLASLESAFSARVAHATATVLDGPHVGMRALLGLTENPTDHRQVLSTGEPVLQSMAALGLETRSSFARGVDIEGVTTRVLVEFRPARSTLWIFSAGDDAKPLMQMAQALGWYIVIADGRSHLASRERFPTADEVRVLSIAELPGKSSEHLPLRATDAAVVMTHSFEQDSRVLASILALDFPLGYLGVLGPQRRTRELLSAAARLLDLPDTPDRLDSWLAQMNAPTGLDLGADTPATIALSILAEVQKSLTAASGSPLCQVRGAKPTLLITHC